MKHNKLFTRITVILLIAIMVLSGCSKKETDSSGTTKPDSVSTSGKLSAGSGETNGGADIESEPATEEAAGDGLVSFFTSLDESKAASDGSSAKDYGSSGEGLYDVESPMAAGESMTSGSGDGEDLVWDDGRDGDGEDFDWDDGRDGDGEDFDWDDGLEPEEPVYIQPAAGLLTSGEWNDNLHYDFLKNLLNNGQEQDYASFFKAWDLTPFSRLAIHVSAGEAAAVSGSAIGTDSVYNALVTVYSEDGNVIWKSRTDNKGMTYAFYRLKGGDATPARVKAESGDFSAEAAVSGEDLLDTSVLEISLEASKNTEKKLDLMFVIDTTGSMGDEIHYLQKELEDVIKRTKEKNGNIPVRLSCNFYRDMSDEYVVRSNEFSSDIDSQLTYLSAEYASGGGDYEEAVELALEDAVNNHSWEEDSVKLMFMVLDAPPHNTVVIKQQLASSLSDAAKKGIRIIPVASSGVDKSTEFLLRTFAMTTGGTYTFLTDHSGIGGSHIEPTIGDYEVENLNDMLVRIISDYIK